jgi:hypothetical protein
MRPVPITAAGRSIRTAGQEGSVFSFSDTLTPCSETASYDNADTSVYLGSSRRDTQRAGVAGVTGELRRVFTLTPFGLGATVSSALWGTLIGAMTLGRPGDRLRQCAEPHRFRDLAVGRRNRHRRLFGSRARLPGGDCGAIVGWFQANIGAGVLLAYGSSFYVAIGRWAPMWGATNLRWRPCPHECF